MNSEKAAAAARRELGIGLDCPVPDLLRLLEDEAGIRVFIVPLPNGGIEGAFQLEGDEPFILINQDRHPTRKRFTLAHEFGHQWLGHGAQMDSEIEIRLTDRQGKEAEANLFAASLLMPRPAIDDWFARRGDPKLSLEVLVRLATTFNVSAYVARYRLQAVNRLTSARLRKSFDEALRASHHYAVTRELGLMRPKDSIDVEDSRGAYVPGPMQANVAELLRRGLLTRDAASARLRLSGQAGAERIDELLEVPPE